MSTTSSTAAGPASTSKPRPALTVSTPAPRALHLPALGSAPLPLASIANIPSPAPRAQRRQTSISYLPPDSPRSWAPGRSASMSSPLRRTGSLKEARERPAEPAVHTLAEKHADLLQFIAQKESRCLDLRSQLAVHEAELRDLKLKWERIVHREFGRVTAPPSSASAAAPAKSASASSSARNSSTSTSTTTAAVVDGFVGGMRMLAAATGNPTPDTTPAPTSAHAHSPSLAARPSPFAKRAARQSQSASISTASTSVGTPRSTSPDDARIASPSSPQHAHEEPMVRDTGATPTVAFVDAKARALRRRSRDDPAKRSPVAPAQPVALGGMGMGMGMQGLGWAALAELQRVPAVAKSQKRASVLFADVSQTIRAALAPVPVPALGSLLDADEGGEEGDGLGAVLAPSVARPTRDPSPAPPPADDDDEDWNW